MGAWCLLEMCVDLLDENRFILNEGISRRKRR